MTFLSKPTPIFRTRAGKRYHILYIHLHGLTQAICGCAKPTEETYGLLVAAGSRLNDQHLCKSCEKILKRIQAKGAKS